MAKYVYGIVGGLVSIEVALIFQDELQLHLLLSNNFSVEKKQKKKTLHHWQLATSSMAY